MTHAQLALTTTPSSFSASWKSPWVLCRSSGSVIPPDGTFLGCQCEPEEQGWLTLCPGGCWSPAAPAQASALPEATQTLEKAFQHSTSLIPLCLPDRIQQSTSGLIKLHCTRLQRTRINRRRRLPQSAKTFWSRKVGEEEITLSKKAELICCNQGETAETQSKGEDTPEAPSNQKSS